MRPITFVLKWVTEQCLQLLVATCAVYGKSLGRKILHSEIIRGHTKNVQVLVRNGLDLNTQDHEGNTSLHIAVMVAQYEIVQCLLANGADANAESKIGFTPLSLAMTIDRTDIAILLLRNGAKHQPKNKEDLPPFRISPWFNLSPTANLLIRGTESGEKYNMGKTALERTQERKELANLLSKTMNTK